MRRAPLLVLLAVLLTFPAAAQNTDIEALSGLQFSFGNPGARSLAMGGAFLGLADDASAAEANPAGLTILRKTEVSIEARNSKTTQTFNVSGTFPDLESDDFFAYSRRVPVNFASIVTPIGENFSLAAYFHSPIEFESEIVNIFGQTDSRGNFSIDPITFFLGPQGPISFDQCVQIDECLQFNLFPFATGVSLRLQTYGLAGAWKMGNLSLGVAARYQQFQERAATIRTDFELVPTFVSQQTSDDEDVTVSAGFKWAFTENFSVGGVYKQGAEFETFLTEQDLSDGSVIDLGTTDFHIPDTYGIGLSFRPIPVLTVNVDAIRVNYSNLTDDFQTVLNLTPDEVAGFESEDITEVHVGAEYFFTTRIPFAVRLGWWREPAHGITYNGSLLSAAGVSARILYPGTEDEDHITGGFGLAWPNFQIDAAYDTSDAFKVGSLSAVFRF